MLRLQNLTIKWDFSSMPPSVYKETSKLVLHLYMFCVLYNLDNASSNSQMLLQLAWRTNLWWF